ncbi:hypothetical protein [Paraburkholderia youngii]|uniref:Uncharacterized protein n=2 Tax=Paraburkholderia youngii TaxID=2782701 RepID=A0A7W8L2C6_9BURK|nr:hypothetical protein [Paraburkholderia youngii]MBB5399034.1 hypothetical protein [Paraburkholderia youngii]
MIRVLNILNLLPELNKALNTTNDALGLALMNKAVAKRIRARKTKPDSGAPVMATEKKAKTSTARTLRVTLNLMKRVLAIKDDAAQSLLKSWFSVCLRLFLKV